MHRFRQSIVVLEQIYNARLLPTDYFWRWIPAVLSNQTIGYELENSIDKNVPVDNNIGTPVVQNEYNLPWELHVHERLRHLPYFPSYVLVSYLVTSYPPFLLSVNVKCLVWELVI